VTDVVKYYFSSRAHLKRARSHLDSQSRESMLYAALELRMGIEARMHQYLEVWDHIPKRQKKDWKIAALAGNLDRAFIDSKKICRWNVFRRDSGDPITCLYYTPVTASLQRAGSLLGSYLHSPKELITDEWWETLYSFLINTYSELQTANIGTLLGPPMLNKKTGGVEMIMETIDEKDSTDFFGQMMAQPFRVDISYPNKLPEKMEEHAHYWESTVDLPQSVVLSGRPQLK